MKILIVTQCFYPDIYAVNDIVKQLVERGHEVTVLTGLPDYTTSRLPKEYKWFRNRKQIYHGVKVYRVSTIARHHGAIFRCLNYMSFAISGWIFASLKKWEDFDVIYVWEVSPVTMAIPAIRLKNRYHKPLFLYCMDLWPESIKAMGFQEESLFYTLVHALSKWIYNRCDHIAVSSTPFFDYLNHVIKYPREKMSYLPQYASEELLQENLEKKPTNHTDFLFIGNIGKVQDVEKIIEASAKIPQELDYTIHLVGGGTNLESCKKLANDLQQMERIKFYGPVPANQTAAFYKIADACLLTLNGDNLIGHTLPGKVQTYMAAGKPILGAINGAGQEIIKESGCGLCVNAGDVNGLAKAMISFINDRERFSQCGEKARVYFKNEFTAKKHFESLENVLQKMKQKEKREHEISVC